MVEYWQGKHTAQAAQKDDGKLQHFSFLFLFGFFETVFLWVVVAVLELIL